MKLQVQCDLCLKDFPAGAMAFISEERDLCRSCYAKGTLAWLREERTKFMDTLTRTHLKALAELDDKIAQLAHDTQPGPPNPPGPP